MMLIEEMAIGQRVSFDPPGGGHRIGWVVDTRKSSIEVEWSDPRPNGPTSIVLTGAMLFLTLLPTDPETAYDLGGIQ